MFHAIDLIMTPITWSFSVMARILSEAGALPAYIALFFVGVVLRLFVRPFIGEARKDVSKATRKNARDSIDKLSGD